MGVFLYLLATVALLIFSYCMHERAIQKDKTFRSRYRNHYSIWSFVFYFSFVFLGIGICALLGALS